METNHSLSEVFRTASPQAKAVMLRSAVSRGANLLDSRMDKWQKITAYWELEVENGFVNLLKSIFGSYSEGCASVIGRSDLTTETLTLLSEFGFRDFGGNDATVAACRAYLLVCWRQEIAYRVFLDALQPVRT